MPPSLLAALRPLEPPCRGLATADLLCELEATRYLAVELAGDPGSRAVAEVWIGQMAAEVERRQRLQRTGDPLLPAWPAQSKLEQYRDRAERVKESWPMDRLCREVLGCWDLRPVRDGEYLARCPLPGHDDGTPSFHLYPDHGWCFGCHRGGDAIRLTELVLGVPFREALRFLETMDGRDVA